MSYFITLEIGNAITWWRHRMETFSALLTIRVGNSPVTGEFPAQRPVTRSFDVFFHLRLNKGLSKQWWGWWFETPSRPFRRHSNDLPTPESQLYRVSTRGTRTQYFVILTVELYCNFIFTSTNMSTDLNGCVLVRARLRRYIMHHVNIPSKNNFAPATHSVACISAAEIDSEFDFMSSTEQNISFDCHYVL